MACSSATQPGVSGTVSSPGSAVPAQPLASCQSLGCSELCIRPLGVSGDNRGHPAALHTRLSGNNHNCRILFTKKWLFAGNRLPSRGSALARPKAKSGGFSASPSPHWGGCEAGLGVLLPAAAHQLCRPPWAMGPLTEISQRQRPWLQPVQCGHSPAPAPCPAQHPGMATALHGPRPYGGNTPVGLTGPAEMREVASCQGVISPSALTSLQDLTVCSMVLRICVGRGMPG